MNEIREGLAAGYGCLSSRADLLDRINIFPVADGDTGANLRISLAPFRESSLAADVVRDRLSQCATGNSGNIAAAFFRELCLAENVHNLAVHAARGREMAWQAVARPVAGTILSVFDSLAAVLESSPPMESLYRSVCSELQQAVHQTTDVLPSLREAGVVDSGALAMYVFFDGMFHTITGQADAPYPVSELFAEKLAIRDSFHPRAVDSYCVDAVVHIAGEREKLKESLAELGESVVVLPDRTGLKIHFHTAEPDKVRQQVGILGEIVAWTDEAIEQQPARQSTGAEKNRPFHIMTDAAGSLTREMARQHCITLLDSYVVGEGGSRPESLQDHQRIYSLLRRGNKVTTAQASNFERHQYYRNVCEEFGRTLYLCVGSAFTGNFAAAMAWKEKNDPANLLHIMDTGAASGRLALIVLLTSRFADLADNPNPGQVVEYAERMREECEEFVFIDQLKYLAAGGRISRASGFVGDMFHLKPVVSPAAEGVRKLGVVRDRKAQVDFALEQLNDRFQKGDCPMIMLQYTDNEEWVAGAVRQLVQELLPGAEILLTPLSLTSGIHMGPGTWSLACAPSGSLTTPPR